MDASKPKANESAVHNPSDNHRGAYMIPARSKVLIYSRFSGWIDGVMNFSFVIVNIFNHFLLLYPFQRAVFFNAALVEVRYMGFNKLIHITTSISAATMTKSQLIFNFFWRNFHSQPDRTTGFNFIFQPRFSFSFKCFCRLTQVCATL
ncbi:hypothetical protein J4731_20435 [Providencia rettgeri]|nr:hypothetical protein [Providencia rettgeri]